VTNIVIDKGRSGVEDGQTATWAKKKNKTGKNDKIEMSPQTSIKVY
jgi:hypothetical protein